MMYKNNVHNEDNKNYLLNYYYNKLNNLIHHNYLINDYNLYFFFGKILIKFFFY